MNKVSDKDSLGSRVSIGMKNNKFNWLIVSVCSKTVHDSLKTTIPALSSAKAKLTFFYISAITYVSLTLDHRCSEPSGNRFRKGMVSRVFPFRPTYR